MSNTNKRPKDPTVITPAGEAVYPKLNKPDTGHDGKAKPAYKIGIRLERSNPAVIALVKAIDEAAEVAIENAKQELAQKPKKEDRAKAEKIERFVPYQIEYVKDAAGNETDDETGFIIFRTKMNASYEDKTTKRVVDLKPDIRDAKKNKLNHETLKLGGGSTVKLAFSYGPFYNAAANVAGVSARLQATQVLKLVEWGGGAGNMFDSEDGFEGDDDVFGNGSSGSSANGDSSDSSGPREDF